MEQKNQSKPAEQQHRISIPKYSLSEELINSISHGVGAALGIAMLVLCIVKSAQAGSVGKVLCSIVFGLSVTLLYLMSCLYHALKVNKAKRVFRVIDHCTIFLLIAGTYTPYTIIALGGALGWSVFGIIWAVAVTGITLNAVNLKKFSKASVVCYLLMGWLIIFAYGHLKAAIAPEGIALLIWGGVAYTVGAILYAVGSKKKYFHSIFHFFCIIGTVLHFFSIYLYVL